MHQQFTTLIEPTKTTIKKVRKAFEETSNRFYKGWDCNYDKRFYDRAKWFVTFKTDSDVKAAIRVIIKTDQRLLPFEEGLNSGIDIMTAETGDCEISGITFTENRPQELYPILAEVLAWIDSNISGRCFAIADTEHFRQEQPKSTFFKRLYQETLKAKDLGHIVKFNDFEYKSSSDQESVLVPWLLHEILPEEIPGAINRVKNANK